MQAKEEKASAAKLAKDASRQTQRVRVLGSMATGCLPPMEQAIDEKAVPFQDVKKQTKAGSLMVSDQEISENPPRRTPIGGEPRIERAQTHEGREEVFKEGESFEGNTSTGQTIAMNDTPFAAQSQESKLSHAGFDRRQNNLNGLLATIKPHKRGTAETIEETVTYSVPSVTPVSTSSGSNKRNALLAAIRNCGQIERVSPSTNNHTDQSSENDNQGSVKSHEVAQGALTPSLKKINNPDITKAPSSYSRDAALSATQKGAIDEEQPHQVGAADISSMRNINLPANKTKIVTVKTLEDSTLVNAASHENGSFPLSSTEASYSPSQNSLLSAKINDGKNDYLGPEGSNASVTCNRKSLLAAIDARRLTDETDSCRIDSSKSEFLEGETLTVTSLVNSDIRTLQDQSSDVVHDLSGVALLRGENNQRHALQMEVEGEASSSRHDLGISPLSTRRHMDFRSGASSFDFSLVADASPVFNLEKDKPYDELQSDVRQEKDSALKSCDVTIETHNDEFDKMLSATRDRNLSKRKSLSGLLNDSTGQESTQISLREERNEPSVSIPDNDLDVNGKNRNAMLEAIRNRKISNKGTQPLCSVNSKSTSCQALPSDTEFDSARSALLLAIKNRNKVELTEVKEKTNRLIVDATCPSSRSIKTK